MSETGVVKFQFEHVARELREFHQLDELNRCRERLLQRGWMGVDENGIGFGNISVRAEESSAFYVTATGTGGHRTLALEDLAKVTAYQFERNWLRCEGAVASSESLTHAAVYEANAAARAVIHCHAPGLWTRLLHVAPTTSGAVEYGTPEMATEVRRLFATTDLADEKIFVMAGHKDGIVSFGATLAEALAALDR
ncbi:MAG: class II aldolase/adducin family protein [Verrucomicrobiota bacterium]|nr:class II aldolase/adducin family protein [Verrucomicrobiota bacterium]